MNKNDLKQIDSLLVKRFKTFVTKDDLRQELSKYATKEDLRAELKTQRDSIVEEIAENINNFMQEVEEKKADRKDVEDLEKQVDKLERKIYQ